MSGEEEKRPSYDELVEENRRLRREGETLRQELERLRLLVERLQRELKRQAAPFSKKEPEAEPKKPGRKPGHRYGRKAFRRRPPRIDEVHEAKLPDACPDCGRDVELLTVRPQYQAEIPRRVIWRQFNVQIGYCSCCGRRVQGRHPLQTSDALGAASSQLGADAQALVSQLKNEIGLPYGKITRLFDVAFGISPCSAPPSTRQFASCSRRNFPQPTPEVGGFALSSSNLFGEESSSESCAFSICFFIRLRVSTHRSVPFHPREGTGNGAL